MLGNHELEYSGMFHYDIHGVCVVQETMEWRVPCSHAAAGIWGSGAWCVVRWEMIGGHTVVCTPIATHCVAHVIELLQAAHNQKGSVAYSTICLVKWHCVYLTKGWEENGGKQLSHGKRKAGVGTIVYNVAVVALTWCRAIQVNGPSLTLT